MNQSELEACCPEWQARETSGNKWRSVSSYTSLVKKMREIFNQSREVEMQYQRMAKLPNT